jgi:uncharacterized protein (TIGR02217 family)
MAIIETEFVLPPSFGIISTWATATAVTRMSGGISRRAGKWSSLLKELTLIYSNRVPADFAQLVNLFAALEGQLDGFLIEDPLDNSTAAPGNTIAATDSVLGTGDGAMTTFQARKQYVFGAKTAYRKITRTRNGTVLCAVDGVPTTAFSVDPVTGVITFDTAPGNGLSVTAGFAFLIPVTFATPKLSLTVTDRSLDSGLIVTGNLPLIEERQ